MSVRPTVTIGLPFYNPGDRFIPAIKSVFAQTYSDWELILINDGSTDNSTEIAKAVDDPRVRFIDDQFNLGLAARLNQVTEAARGEFLVRMDADDLMDTNRVQVLVSAFAKSSDVQFVSSAVIAVDKSNNIIGRSANRTSRITHGEILRSGGIAHPTIAARRGWFLKNPYKLGYHRAEDRELFTRAFQISEYQYIEQPLYYYFTVGNVRVDAYLESYRTERRILREYGPKLIGWKRTATLIIRSMMKSILLKWSGVFGLQNRIFRQSYQALTNEEQGIARRNLVAVENTRLPLKS